MSCKIILKDLVNLTIPISIINMGEKKKNFRKYPSQRFEERE